MAKTSCVPVSTPPSLSLRLFRSYVDLHPRAVDVAELQVTGFA